MFFTLSKLLAFLIQPLTIIVILMLGALLFSGRIRKQLLIAALVITVLLSNQILARLASRAWAVNDSFQENRNYDVGIVLTGMLFYNEDYRQRDFGSSVDRITESLRLYREGKVKTLLISGGVGSLVDTNRHEAVILKDFLVNECAVPDSVIRIDSLSRNTYENAVNSARIVRSEKYQSVLLITSASHMRRAKALFDKQGLRADTYSADRGRPVTYYPDDFLVPSLDALESWASLFHELVGMTVYRIKGYL